MCCLVSGTNIKTINNNSIIGAGNLNTADFVTQAWFTCYGHAADEIAGASATVRHLVSFGTNDYSNKSFASNPNVGYIGSQYVRVDNYGCWSLSVMAEITRTSATSTAELILCRNGYLDDSKAIFYGKGAVGNTIVIKDKMLAGTAGTTQLLQLNFPATTILQADELYVILVLRNGAAIYKNTSPFVFHGQRISA